MNGAGDARTLAAGAATPAALGERLARAREQLNLSAADIARQLKLSVSQVEALETGRYHLLPGPVFVRGFIRNYARLVKLDPEELLREAGESLPRTAARPETPPSQDIPFPVPRRRIWRRYALAGGFIVAALAAYELFLNEPGSGTPAVSMTPVPLPVAPSSEPPATAGAAQGFSHAAEAEAAPATQAPSAAPEESGAGARIAAAAAREDEPQPRPGERMVRLEFTEECWVEIRDRNGRVVFSQLNRPGTVRHVSGVPPLAVVVGNAHGVRMSYEGEPVDLARHTKIDVARLTLP